MEADTMRLRTLFFFIAIGLLTLYAPAAFADGEVCSAVEKKEADATLKKAEDAERAGRTKDAYAIATGTIPFFDCAPHAYKRRDGIIERTSRKLGEEAEKAGRFGDAFEYFSAPHRHISTDHDLSAAERVMFEYANANPDSYKAVSQAVSYFNSREGTPHLKEVRALAKRGGDKMLAKEENAFAARKDSLDELQQAKEWFDLAGEGKQAEARAEQRGDSLLAEGSVRSVERAFSYFDFAHNRTKLNSAKARARKLGDDAASKGDHGLATKFYELSGDKVKAGAVEKQKEKTESQRQDKFKKEQESLEKELGL
jgi:hypothetical protein